MQDDYRQTLDIRELCLELRNDVQCAMASYGEEKSYVIEDLSSGKFYRVGFAEYALISCFDGRTSIGQAIAQTSASLKDAALSEQEATVVCKWLLDSGLAAIEYDHANAKEQRWGGAMQKRRWMAAANPISPRFALLNPYSFLQATEKWAALIYSWVFLAIWVATVCFGLYFGWIHSDKIFGSLSWSAVSPWSIVVFAAIWIVLKFAHEMAHATSCHRFGGRVVEAGIMLLLLIPLPYVDVTSAWRLRSRAQRILIAAAGMMAEFFFAAIAAIVLHYYQTSPLTVQTCQYVIISASLTTLLFNANPLMKFDGYFILSDILGLPNLATHASQLVNGLLTRLFFGQKPKPGPWPEKHRATLLTYGVLAIFWRVLICAGLFAGAAFLFHGAGIVLAGLALLMWTAPPLMKLGKTIKQHHRREPKSAWRCAGLLGVCGVLAFCALQAPFSIGMQAPAIVDYRSVDEVRSSVRGFVDHVHVADGDLVQGGQLLVTLSNPELRAEADRLELEISKSEAQARKYRIALDLAAAQVEQRNLDGMRKRLVDLQDQLVHLKIKAPVAGRILQSEIDALQGRFVTPGEHVLDIGSDDNVLLKCLIAQDDIEQFRRHEDKEVYVHINGLGIGWEQSRIQMLSPSAQTRLPHPAFNAQYGGDITVLYTEENAENEKGAESADPTFISFVDIPANLKNNIAAGQRATVLIGRDEETIGGAAASWLKQKVQSFFVRHQQI